MVDAVRLLLPVLCRLIRAAFRKQADYSSEVSNPSFSLGSNWRGSYPKYSEGLLLRRWDIPVVNSKVDLYQTDWSTMAAHYYYITSVTQYSIYSPTS